MTENGFTMKKKTTKKKKKTGSRPYIALTITDSDYEDNLSLLENTTARVESLLCSLEQAVRSIGLQ